MGTHCSVFSFCITTADCQANFLCPQIWSCSESRDNWPIGLLLVRQLPIWHTRPPVILGERIRWAWRRAHPQRCRPHHVPCILPLGPAESRDFIPCCWRQQLPVSLSVFLFLGVSGDTDWTAEHRQRFIYSAVLAGAIPSKTGPGSCKCTALISRSIMPIIKYWLFRVDIMWPVCCTFKELLSSLMKTDRIQLGSATPTAAFSWLISASVLYPQLLNPPCDCSRGHVHLYYAYQKQRTGFQN